MLIVNVILRIYHVVSHHIEIHKQLMSREVFCHSKILGVTNSHIQFILKVLEKFRLRSNCSQKLANCSRLLVLGKLLPLFVCSR